MDIDVSNLSVDYCKECGEGSYCVEGLGGTGQHETLPAWTGEAATEAA